PGGDGVAHLPIGGERRAVFLSRTAPGDVVRAEVDASQRPARGRVVEVLHAGAGRVAPACSFVDACGACDSMHLSAGAQAEAHAEHARAALPPAWRALPVAVHPAPRLLGYRTRVRVHVRCDRGRTTIGMYRPRSHEPVPVASCVVLDAALERA